MEPGTRHQPLFSLLEPSCRGKGLGTEAALMMLSYGEQVMWGVAQCRRVGAGDRYPTVA